MKKCERQCKKCKHAMQKNIKILFPISQVHKKEPRIDFSPCL